MIAVDTNILVYAHREESPWHARADAQLAQLAESGHPWAIPWPCVHEFLVIVTHPRVFDPPTPLETALRQVECWLESPRLHTLGEPDGYWATVQEVLRTGRITGPRVHDGRIGAICLAHGVTELWSADRDFGRVRGLVTRNPLLD